MSEPLRFKPVNPAHEMIYSTDGGWVSWEDYARLKAEVERLTAFTTRTIIPNEELQKQVEELELEVFAFDRTIKQASCHYDNRLEDIRQLQAQVERLTKAGDAMAEEFSFIGSPDGGFNSIERWLAAKEGKPHA
jgi:hypothetical protein